MASNPYVNKVVFGNETLIDLSGDTLTSASQVASGVTAHLKTGEAVTGTAVTPSGTRSITANGTYDVTNYASANVAVTDLGSTLFCYGGLASTDTVTLTTPSSVTKTGTWTQRSVSGTATYGWYFNGLDELGTFTVTASNGTKTITSSVAMSIVGAYYVEMEYVTYLYKLGNECTSITGGWVSNNYRPYGWGAVASAPPLTKNASSFTVSISSTNYNVQGSIFTVNAIDITSYSTLKIHIVSGSNINGDATTECSESICITPTSADGYGRSAMSKFLVTSASSTTTASDLTVSVDISSALSSMYVAFSVACYGHNSSTGTLTYTIDKIWLE